MRRSQIALAAVAMVVVVAVGALALRGGGRTELTTTTTASGPLVTSPYDLTEAGDDVDLADLREAKFASLLLETPEGLTSYMVASGQAPFSELAEAVGEAVRVDESAAGTNESLTFVMPDRITVTFALDIPAGLLAREGMVWRIDGDLEALVRAVTVLGPAMDTQ